MGLELLFLLLPLAALSGWWIGRNGQKTKGRNAARDLSQGYLQGLNYLISEQPDKAIEVFVRMLDVDSDTIETHFALGSLFRRRGEVDRAIRIHQNLIARPALSLNQRNHALYELGRDYFAAGLLDRAENLFAELTNDPELNTRALAQLQDIYQQEKEWDKAIEVASRLAYTDHAAFGPTIAHYHCELAEQAMQEGDRERAVRLVKKALAADRLCVRASLLEAELELRRDQPKAALKALGRIEHQDPEFITESMALMQRAYEKAGKTGQFIAHLKHLFENSPSTSIVLAYTESVRTRQGTPASAAMLTEQLRVHPSLWGLLQLIGMKLEEQRPASREDILLVQELLTRYLETKPRYRCKSCGFVARALHWQCPGCKQWNTVKPIQGFEGE
ncbi:MAG: lipopolysaccharide assembly protein LapB [Thiohalomonadaceae bacterium]